MTREEAKAFLGSVLPTLSAKMQLAIEVLNQELCDDCISREDTLAEFKKVYFDNATVIRCAELVLGGMPSVTPQPKMGRWINTGDYLTAAYGSVDYVKCSCCGEDSLEEGDFCPNCGARMESEK